MLEKPILPSDKRIQEATARPVDARSLVKLDIHPIRLLNQPLTSALRGPDLSSVANDFRSEPAESLHRIALIGGFRPRKCGIATFTTDLFEQLGAFRPDITVDVHAMLNRADDAVDRDVSGTIFQHERDSYREAAARINAAGVNAVWLQHEFGIFGGDCGEYVLDLVDRVAAPLIVTLHTVLAAPSPQQRAIMHRLVDRASCLMVMSARGRQILVDHYGADAGRVTVIEHGAPDRPFGRQQEFREQLGLSGRTILMTFGLLGPGKGLETVIRALPAVIAGHPDVIYRIVGATHPNLVVQQGETYRHGLQCLARDIGVDSHIEWDDRFLDTAELLDQLEACDIYITPYPNLQQSTSGTLSFAVALGKAVISTPYVHARELLADGVGMLVPPEDPGSIAAEILGLLDNRSRLTKIQRRAWERGRATVWSAFAAAAARLVEETAVRPHAAPIAKLLALTPALGGLWAMTDGTGILQHGIGVVPDRDHGYCLDDNARALMLTNVLPGVANTDLVRGATTYASFVQHSWNPDRRVFRNFMNYDRSWCEDVGSEDSNGRAIWTLGHSAGSAVTDGLRDWAAMWFDRTADIALSFGSPRAIGFSMLGAAEIIGLNPTHDVAGKILKRGGARLSALFDRPQRSGEWMWFEDVLGYDNPRLCEALLKAGTQLANDHWVDQALAALDFLCRTQTSGEGHFRPVGSAGFGQPFQSLPFDQQPLEAWAAIETCAVARRITRDEYWVRHAQAAYRWFFGANDRGVVLADPAAGICRDGITPHGMSKNVGAESLLAFQLAHCAMIDLAAGCRIVSSKDHDASGMPKFAQPVATA